MRNLSLSRIFQTTKDIAVSFEMQFGPHRGRSLQVAGASCIASAAAGMGKLAMGLVSLSLFTCVSAFYSFAMVIAKVVALSALVRETGREFQLRSCTLAGQLLIVASALYMVYSARSFIPSSADITSTSPSASRRLPSLSLASISAGYWWTAAAIRPCFMRCAPSIWPPLASVWC